MKMAGASQAQIHATTQRPSVSARVVQAGGWIRPDRDVSLGAPNANTFSAVPLIENFVHVEE